LGFRFKVSDDFFWALDVEFLMLDDGRLTSILDVLAGFYHLDIVV